MITCPSRQGRLLNPRFCCVGEATAVDRGAADRNVYDCAGFALHCPKRAGSAPVDSGNVDSYRWSAFFHGCGSLDSCKSVPAQDSLIRGLCCGLYCCHVMISSVF